MVGATLVVARFAMATSVFSPVKTQAQGSPLQRTELGDLVAQADVFL